MFCNHWFYSSPLLHRFTWPWLSLRDGPWSASQAAKDRRRKVVQRTSQHTSSGSSGCQTPTACFEDRWWVLNFLNRCIHIIWSIYVSMVYHQIKGIQGILVHNWGYNPSNPMNTVLGSVSIAGVRSKPRQAAAKRVCSQASCCLPISQYETHHLAGLTTHLHPFMAIWLYS